ncbi:MAG: GGDEF domain-containing protein [Deferribacteraceae bacterium]|jgi:diguanylate cyclase (GGDEF)-like protein|nr:GGDEF domain-containing protein [Deferribacteraceae bacterium]
MNKKSEHTLSIPKEAEYTLSFLQSFIKAINIVILIQEKPGIYKPIGEAPDFYKTLYPPEDGFCSEPWNYSDFLEFFKEEAEIFFDTMTDPSQTYTSTVWQEEGISEDRALIATALVIAGKKIIVIRSLAEDYVERVKVLRKARENLLETRALYAKLEKYRHIAQYDSLTGLFNRLTFNEVLEEEMERCTKTRVPLSLLVIDLDDFKKVNDTFGHMAGDSVLSNLGRILSTQLRAGDIPARYGGEEFVVIAPNTNEEQVLVMADNLRKKVESFDFGEPPIVTVSIGCTTYRSPEDRCSFFQRADFALYDAKRSTKNMAKLR